METVRALLLAIKDLASNPPTSNPHSPTDGKIKSNDDHDDNALHKHVDDLNNFENYSRTHDDSLVAKEECDDEFIDEKCRLDEMDDFATHVANRAVRLRDGVLELLRAALSSQSQPQQQHPQEGDEIAVKSDPDVVASSSSSNSFNSSALPSVLSLKERIVHLETELRENDERLEEMAKARNEAVASERRVRRGLYRLAIVAE